MGRTRLVNFRISGELALSDRFGIGYALAMMIGIGLMIWGASGQRGGPDRGPFAEYGPVTEAERIEWEKPIPNPLRWAMIGAGVLIVIPVFVQIMTTDRK
jgi:hypothetical protein